MTLAQERPNDVYQYLRGFGLRKRPKSPEELAGAMIDYMNRSDEVHQELSEACMDMMDNQSSRMMDRRANASGANCDDCGSWNCDGGCESCKAGAAGDEQPSKSALGLLQRHAPGFLVGALTATTIFLFVKALK